MIWALKGNERITATPKDKANCPLCNEEVIAKCGTIKIWHWAHKSNKDCDDWYEPETEWHRNWKNEFLKEQQEVTIKKCVSDYCYEKKYGHNHPDEYNHGNCVDCEFVNHRADIKTKRGIIVELQNSPISADKICDREKFYNKMIWLLNGNNIASNLKLRKKGNYFTFRWKNPPKSWWIAIKDIYIDLGEYIDCSFNNARSLFEDRLKNFDISSFIDYIKNKESDYYKEKINDILYLLKEKAKEYNNCIFFIKKIYPKIPCGGWGYLITREEFLRRFR